MTQAPIPPFANAEVQNHAMLFSNQLSAYYSIPLIECIYYNGCSIDQMRKLKTVFEILVTGNHYSDAFTLFILLYQHTSKKKPVPLYALAHFPILIPFFLFEFLEDFDSLLSEFEFDEDELD